MVDPRRARPRRARRQRRCSPVGERLRRERRLRPRPPPRDDASSADVASRPVPSLFRGFSAPVKVTLDLANGELLTLLRHDTDPFNRWQAAQTVAMRLLVGQASGGERRRRRRRGACRRARRLPRQATRWTIRPSPPSPCRCRRSRHRAGDRPRRRSGRRAPRPPRACAAGSASVATAARLEVLRGRPRLEIAPTAPTRRAPAGARCATRRSTSSPRPTRRRRDAGARAAREAPPT